MSTNMCSRSRTRWVSVKEFQEIYGLKQAQAYKLVSMKDFPKKKFGEKLIRINLNEAEEFINKRFNY